MKLVIYHPTIVAGWATEKGRRPKLLARRARFAMMAMARLTALTAISLQQLAYTLIESVYEDVQLFLTIWDLI